MNRKIRKYTNEFKQDGIPLTLRSVSVSQTAKDLEIPEATVHGWVNKVSKNVLNKTGKESEINIHEELKKLRKENTNLKEEREILKKAAAYFAKEIR